MGFDSQWVQGNQPCPRCGSSDGLAIKDDGFNYCHACDTSGNGTPGTTDFNPENRSMPGLIPQEQIEYVGVASRGISFQTAKKFRYGKAQFHGQTVHVAQFTDPSGAVVAQKLRKPDKTFTWLGSKEHRGLFGLDRARDSGERILITEGELDALACAEVLNAEWFPCVSLPDGASQASKSIKADLEKLERFEEIYLCFDNDKAGAAAVEAVTPLFKPGKVKVVKLARKDACDMLKAGESKELRDSIYTARSVKPEGILSGDEILEAIKNGPSLTGEPYEWGGLNDKLIGIRDKELILIAGGSGTGKSTITKHLAHHCIKTGHTVGYIALEESVKQSALGIYGIELQQRLHLMEELPMEEIEKVHAEMSPGLHLYDHFGSMGSDDLISKIRYLIIGMGCDRIVLDHITIAISGLDVGDERKALDKMLTNIREVIEQTGATLFLISHLSRPKDGSHEEGKQISGRDLRGSHSLNQIPDVIIGAERDLQAEDGERNIMGLRILKNRPVGRTGLCCKLKYIEEAGILVEIPLETEPVEEFPEYEG